MAKTAPALPHPFPFDPTYGFDLPGVLEVSAPPGPPDFAGFWRETSAAVRSVPLEIETRKITSPHSGYDLLEVEFNSLDRVRIGGWITVPHQSSAGGWVVGHGYGGREAAEFNLPSPAGPAIFPCARGFHRSAHAGIPGEAARHVVHGIETRATYVHRGCTADIWAAASVLIELFPAAAANLKYYGASFGGGIGALALPWDRRFHKAFLDIPSFGSHPLRVQLPCVGSGEFVRFHHRHHPGVLNVLAYFDAATAARHIGIPVFVAAALFDPAVPPPGQFAIYNALAGPTELYVRSAAHFDSIYAGPEDREIHALLSEWFTT